MMKVGFLGPRGTFSETAVWGFLNRHHIPPENIELIPVDSIANLMRSYQSDLTCEFVVVPVENSIEGPVLITQDMFISMDSVSIQEEFSVAIVNHLLVLPGVNWTQVTDVISHPQPIGQCQHFLNSAFNSRPHLHFSDSTASAARVISERREVRSGVSPEACAAIGSDRLAGLYGLDIAQSGIQDNQFNRTRFWVLSRTPSRMSGEDKTSIIFSCRKDRAGGLVEILSEFSTRSINLTSISSRPTKLLLGEYLFFVDFIGHVDDAVIIELLSAIKRRASFFKLIGSYRVIPEEVC